MWQKTNEENENDALFDICNELNDENAAEYEQDPLLHDFLQKSFVKGRIQDVQAAIQEQTEVNQRASAVRKDPYLKYGIGINNYFQL